MAQPANRKFAGYGPLCRLRSGKDIERVFASATSRVGRTMVLRAVAGSTANSRCGVIASKRTFRRAVDRNRAKRLLREAFRLERDVLPFPCDIVLIARKWISRCTIQAVRMDFCHLAADIKAVTDVEEGAS